VIEGSPEAMMSVQFVEQLEQRAGTEAMEPLNVSLTAKLFEMRGAHRRASATASSSLA
jgi:hypothetical protein